MKQVKGPGFGNGMFAMIQRNAGMLQSKSYFDTRTEYWSIAKRIRVEDYKTATPQQLKEIRILFKEARRQAFLKNIIIMVLALVLTVAIIYGLIYWMRMVFGF